MLETFARERVTLSFCAPTSYRFMLGVPDMRRRFDLGALRLGVSAAEPLPGATWEAWHAATGVELLDGIGSTEMFHIFVSSMPGRVRPGATGLPVPGYDCRVVDDEGREVPPDKGVDCNQGAYRLQVLAQARPPGTTCASGAERHRRRVRAGLRGILSILPLGRHDRLGATRFRAPRWACVDEHPAVAESAVVPRPMSHAASS